MEIIKLPASERPKQIYTYTVTGSGIFPTDMLRYDRSSPRTTEDAVNIMRQDLRSVELRSFHSPTADRWASFGWRIK
jgi:hypothetical protein